MKSALFLRCLIILYVLRIKVRGSQRVKIIREQMNVISEELLSIVVIYYQFLCVICVVAINSVGGILSSYCLYT